MNNDNTDTLRARHLLERYRTCKDAAGVEKVQEQIFAELEESYAAARRASGTGKLCTMPAIYLVFAIENDEQSDLLVANPNHPPLSDSDSEPGSDSEGTSTEG
jgi:hypothetical protein